LHWQYLTEVPIIVLYYVTRNSVHVHHVPKNGSPTNGSNFVIYQPFSKFFPCWKDCSISNKPIYCNTSRQCHTLSVLLMHCPREVGKCSF